MRKRGKFVVQKLMGTAMIIVGICGIITLANIAVVACAMVLGLVFLFSRKIIFEI